jgi:hypothetical protein
MNAVAVGGIAFACVFGGALLGMYLSAVLPDHHLSAASTAVVRLAIGVIIALTTLVVSLTISSTRGSLAAKDAEFKRASADVVLLDRALAHYGPETKDARDLLRRVAESRLCELWPEDCPRRAEVRPSVTSAGIEEIQDLLRALAPKNDAQRWLQSRALQLSTDIEQVQWLILEQAGSTIGWPTLVIVLFWLTIIFVSFGFSAPRNATVIGTLLVCSLSIGAAIYLILQMDDPYSGLIKVSSAPLRTAIGQLGR